MAEDATTRQAERWLRDIINELVIKQSASGDKLTEHSVRIASSPQSASSDKQKEFTMAAFVFPAFQDLLLRRVMAHKANEKRLIRVNSFEHPNHPWFDVWVEGGTGFFIFRVHQLHAISHLRSAG